MSDWHSPNLSMMSMKLWRTTVWEILGPPSHSHSSVSCCWLSLPPLSLSTSCPVLIYSPSSFCQAVFGAMLEPVPPIPLICLLSATPRTATFSWMVAMLTMSQVRILPPFHERRFLKTCNTSIPATTNHSVTLCFLLSLVLFKTN